MASAQLRLPELPRTVAEFVDWLGDGTGAKYELICGELRAMAPASFTHGLIQANLARLIGNHLIAAGLPCLVVAEPGVVPRLTANDTALIPDLGVTCIESPDVEHLMYGT